MSYTIEQLFTRACSLVDSLTDAGAVDANTTADYRGRTLTLVDMAQKDLSKVADYFKIYEISRKPVDNMLGNGNYFDVQEYDTSEDLTFEASSGGVKSYYFEADSNGGTAYIEDYTSTWNTLATISLVNTTDSFMAYKASVTPTSGATASRIRFTGTYYYRVVNLALYNMAFENVGKIPVYKPWVNVTLPTDLKTIDKVIDEYFPRNYEVDPFYKIEWDGNRQSLYIDHDYCGKIRVQYRPITTVPTAFTDTILIDDITAQAICYFLAMNFVATEQNDMLTNIFRNEYNRLKNEATIKPPQGMVEIQDFCGGF